ncbi:MAG: BglG family transcription antiterminator [Lachnospiraceae bacterium]|nr:BglG family transcription antiterminator [Lachnospiraceae bacterium]
MDITPRMKQILQVLIKQSEPISVRCLAEEVGISKRTVQRELEYVQDSLKEYHLTFMSKTGTGVWLDGTEENRALLRDDLYQGDSYDASNREERRKRLILEILKEKGLKKLFYYSSQFKVSEATISTDLEAIEGWLNRYHICIVRKPGSGISVEGSEENYRRGIRAFVDENLDTDLIRDFYKPELEMDDTYEKLSKSSMGQILNDDILRRVINCIVGMDNPRIMTLTQSSYVGLVIHISIAINRILNNEMLEPEQKWIEEIQEDEDYLLAKAISEELEEEFEIEIPKVETSYIWLHVKGAKHEKIQVNGHKTMNIENKDLQVLVNEMIDVFDPEKAFLLKQDDEFIQGLLAHLQPTFIRLIHNMQIRNPVLEDIKRDYPDIFRRCLEVSKVLMRWTGEPVPDEETGFLTVHFGAALVRLEAKKESLRPVEVGVVCSSGIGISRLMSSKLNQTFRERMLISTYGKNDLTPYIISKTDFFVSSIPLDMDDFPVVSVSPLLNEEDMQEIRRMLYQYERTPRKRKESDEFSNQLEEINLMAEQIRTVIKYMCFFKVDNRITFEELLIAIGEKLSPYSDRREMIQEDIMKRERLSSQIFSEFGFALLHTRTKGVVRPSFSICMTKDLGAFTDPCFKGITVVFVMLLPIDDHIKVNSGILGYISSMLIEDVNFLEIVTHGDKEEIRDTLSGHLKKYFSKFLYNN